MGAQRSQKLCCNALGGDAMDVGGVGYSLGEHAADGTTEPTCQMERGKK